MPYSVIESMSCHRFDFTQLGQHAQFCSNVNRTYDSQGNVANFTDLAVGGATHYQYEPIFNQVTTIVDPQGHTTNVAYDSAGNPKKIETTLGQTVVFTYNAQALPSQIQDVLGAITTFAYDSKGNPIALTRAAGNEQRQYNMAYTAEGYLQSITDGQGRTVNQTYDAAGRITAQVLPDGNQLNYTYDAAGQVTTITPPGRLAHTFAYNDLGLVVAYTPPSVSNGGPTTYQYNRTQQITRIALRGSQLVDFHYDTAGRLARMTQPRGETSYHYDNLTGNLLEIQAPQGVNLAYQYSYGGRVANVAWSGPVAGTLYRTYDSSGRIFSLSVNQEAPFYYSYNGNGLPVYAGGLSLTYDDPRGLLTNTTLGYVQENYSHNGFGEVTTHQVQSWDLNSAMMVDRYQAHYIRNNLGWITKQTETISGTTTVYDYAYDLAGRLSTIKKDGLTATTYTYDSNGNRLSDGARTATYDAQDRLLQYGDTVYTYTPNGDLLAKMRNGQTTTYGYDALNNLMNVTLPDGRKIDYLVDGNNRRVGKMVGGTLVQGFLYIDTLNPMAELDGNNNIVSQFVYATRPNVPDFMIKNGSTYRLILDHLGSPRLVIDHNTGQIMQQLAYDAFGNVLLDTNPGFQPFGFAGGLYDRDTKLIRFGARDYDAEVGRWTTKDPILFEGDETNLYGYTSNNPINFQDMTGTRLVKGGPKPWKPASSACSLAAEIVNKGLDTIPTLKTIPAKKELLKGACEIGQAIREEIDKEKIEAFDSCMKGGNDPFTCHDIATGARPKLDHNWQEREEARKTVRRQYDELMRKIGQPQDSVEDTCRP